MLLPDPQRRGDIHFVFAKSAPYARRLCIVASLLATGFLIQLFAGSVLAGAPFLLAASLLSVVKGYRNYPATTDGKKEWRTGDKEQLQKVLSVADKAKRWDQSALDISCATGFAALAGLVVLISGGASILAAAGQEWAAHALAVDAAVLLLPHWITGIRRILVNAPLTVKVDNLLRIWAAWEANKASDESMMAQIEVVHGDKGEMPVDAKLILQFPSLGDTFLGVQVQVVLNNVQGRDYPYVYCVLVARTALKMRKELSDVQGCADACSGAAPAGLKKLFQAASPGIVAEWQRDQDLDILVIRQRTSKTSGYHTDEAMVAGIFRFARQMARRMVATVRVEA